MLKRISFQKVRVALFIIFACGIQTGCLGNQHATGPDRCSYILAKDGLPTIALDNLCAYFHLDHNGTLKGMVDCTQTVWLRKPGEERWDMEQKYEEQKDEVLPLLGHLGVLTEVKPQRVEYDYALLLGALVTRVRTRLAVLADLWRQGVRFKQIVVLTGARPLQKDRESLAALCDVTNEQLPIQEGWQFVGTAPTTEAGMMKLIYEQAALPQGMRQVPVKYINTPMQPTDDGGERRPSTFDTIQCWQDTKPAPGSCLAISNQPYVSYQDAVLRSYMPPSFYLETVGHEARYALPIAVHLDNIARWLYSELKRT